MKERGYEGLVGKDAESVYRGGPTRSWVKVKVRQEGRFVLGGILGLPHTFAGILVGQRVGRRLLLRGAVERGSACGPRNNSWNAGASEGRRRSMISGCPVA